MLSWLPSLEVLTFNFKEGMSQAIIAACSFVQGRESGPRVLELRVRMPADDKGERAAFESLVRDFEALFPAAGRRKVKLIELCDGAGYKRWSAIEG